MDGSFELMDEGMAQGGRGHSVSDQTSLTIERNCSVLDFSSKYILRRSRRKPHTTLLPHSMESLHGIYVRTKRIAQAINIVAWKRL